MISIIVATGAGGVIGRGGALPWHLRSDLQYFKAITMGKPVVMGRKTHESIGRPLPGRRNIVLTRQDDYAAPGCSVVATVQAAVDAAGEASEIMVIGGGDIYRLFLPLAGRVYLTEVAAEIDGDTFFPELPEDEWRETAREPRPRDADNDYDYAFVVLERR